MMPIPLDTRDTQGSGSGTKGTNTTGEPAAARFESLETSCRDAIGKVSDAAQKLRKAWGDLVAAVDKAFAKINDMLSGVWASVVEWWTEELSKVVAAIQAKMEEIRKKLDGLLAKLDSILTHSTPVVSLLVTAQNWVHQVETPLSGLPTNMMGSGKIDNWRGPARITYNTRVSDQIEATNAVVSKVKATAGWLGDVGQTNTEYMANLVVALSPVVNEVIQLIIDIVEAGLPTQIPEALSQISALLGQLVETEITLAATMVSNLVRVFNDSTKLDIETGDQSGLGGQWPQTVKVPG